MEEDTRLSVIKMYTTAIENQKRRLKELIEAKAFLSRSPLTDKPFILASGDESWVFFDCKQVTQNSEGISLVAEIFFEMVKDYHLDAIGGIQTGAIPICTAVAQLSYLKGLPIQAFWVREKRKDHGTMNKIEGGLQPNSRVVVVDDVTTKGTSVLKAIDEVLEINCQIAAVITLVDREAGARDIIEQTGLKYRSIFKKSDFKVQA
ncbi:MAG: orotate phosphoribosyltransferase [Nitrososphaerota archaeon]|jgi:orotate phosphoribosyltransferase|nr:orotate phosphoribosyltransferase [Nitrososphaerota archaeon]